MAALFDLDRKQVTVGHMPVVEVCGASVARISRCRMPVASSTSLGRHGPGRNTCSGMTAKGVVTPLPLARGWYQNPRVARWQVAGHRNPRREADSDIRLRIGGRELDPAPDVRRQQPRAGVRRRQTGGVSIRSRRRSRDLLAASRGRRSRAVDAARARHVPYPGVLVRRRDALQRHQRRRDDVVDLSLRDRKASRFGDVTSIGVPTNAVFSPMAAGSPIRVAMPQPPSPHFHVQPFPATGTKSRCTRAVRCGHRRGRAVSRARA